MTPKQERFCQEYTIDYNGTQAAIRAGFSEQTACKQASRMLTNVDILARVRELQAEQTRQLAISADFVIQQLHETLNRCMDPSNFDSKGALRALELLGKHLGMFEDRLRVNAHIDTGKLDSILAQLWEPDPNG